MTSPSTTPVHFGPGARPQEAVGEHWAELIGIGLFALMSIQTWGSVTVLGQFSLLLLLIMVRPWAAFDLVTRWSFLFAVPLMACLSAIWSTAPQISSRYGVQLLITALIGALAARAVSPRAFVRVLFFSALVVCVGSVLDGKTGSSATGMVLVGLTGSKNQIAYVAQFVITSAVAILADRQQPQPVRIAAVLSLPLSLWLLVQSNASTGLVTTALGVSVFFGTWALMVTRPIYRAAMIGGMLAAMVPIAVALPALNEAASEFTFNVLKKDATLTGRTYLWARADELISDRPVLGHGYRAVWLGSGADSIGLLRWAKVPDPRGFHFHDSYREMAVDLGVTGAALFAAGLLLIGAGLAFKAITGPSIPTAYFLSLFAMLAMRSKGDLIIGPFSPFYAVQFSLAVYALRGAGTRLAAALEPKPAGPPRVRGAPPSRPA